jgi:hypothetical protein
MKGMVDEAITVDLKIRGYRNGLSTDPRFRALLVRMGLTRVENPG